MSRWVWNLLGIWGAVVATYYFVMAANYPYVRLMMLFGGEAPRFFSV